MKKLLIITFAFLFSINSAFARVELSPRLFGDFMFSNYKNSGYKEDFNINTFGAELQCDLFFINLLFLNAGLCAGIDLGFGSFKFESETKNLSFSFDNLSVSSTSSSMSNNHFTIGFMFAPSVQLNIGSRHSIFAKPGVRASLTRVNLSDGKTTSAVAYFIPEFLIEAGYKFWLLNHFSLLAGYRYEIPMGLFKSGDKIIYDIAQAHRVFIGASIKLLD